MKKRIIRLSVGALIFVAALFVPAEPWWLRLAVFLAAYGVIGYKVIFKAVRNICYGKVFDENFLMAIASIGAFAIGEYPEAVAVMLFYQVGELFEDFAVGRSRRSITDLMDIRPDYANLKIGDKVEKVEPDQVKIGDLILVRPGEKLPLDGVVVEGDSMVDTAALTGESAPREVMVGSQVLSGCINLNGLLVVKVTKVFGESTVSKILDLVENATIKKAKTENFITRFAVVYTPVVVMAAVVLAVVPPLVIEGAVFTDWLYRALEFLVVSCPCALVISVPLSFFGGIGGASKAGVLIKGSNYLEAMASAEYVVMDKTGTLTQGVFQVEKCQPAEGFTEAELLYYGAHVESYSTHPISTSLKQAYEAGNGLVDQNKVKNVEELSGYGVTALIDGKLVAAGNGKLMEQKKVDYCQDQMAGTVVHVAIDQTYAGYILIADKLKEDAVSAVAGLKKRGIQTVMLTGDNRAAGEAVGQKLGIDQVYTELLPDGKVEKVEALLAGKSKKGKLIFVGDGINDAPVLARADVGVAMGGLGSDAAIEAADIVIMNDEPSKLTKIMDIARKTMVIVKENIVFALGIKLLVLALCAVGLVNMWAAVFADVGVSVLAILNSFRAMRVKDQ
ncbi:MAG: cadmium-translocating P-type ATPase [Firmicutes bacterium]|nr:cadmium-translocating P-type ATPase [Bacillota bacterium]